MGSYTSYSRSKPWKTTWERLSRTSFIVYNPRENIAFMAIPEFIQEVTHPAAVRYAGNHSYKERVERALLLEGKAKKWKERARRLEGLGELGALLGEACFAIGTHREVAASLIRGR